LAVDNLFITLLITLLAFVGKISTQAIHRPSTRNQQVFNKLIFTEFIDFQWLIYSFQHIDKPIKNNNS